MSNDTDYVALGVAQRSDRSGLESLAELALRTFPSVRRLVGLPMDCLSEREVLILQQFSTSEVRSAGLWDLGLLRNQHHGLIIRVDQDSGPQHLPILHCSS